MLSEHPYKTQLSSCYYSRRIPHSFSDRGNTYLLLFEHDKGWKEVETSKSCLKSVTYFPVHTHFAALHIVRLSQFLNPTVRVILGVLSLQTSPSFCLVILSCVSVLKQDTREKIFSQGHQEKYEDVVKRSDAKAIGSPVQGG